MKYVALVPGAAFSSSIEPSQSLSMPSHRSSQPPGSEAQLAFTALHAAVVVLVHATVPTVLHAPWPGGGSPSSLAHGLPKFATFSFVVPLQLLSSASHTSIAAAQL